MERGVMVEDKHPLKIKYKELPVDASLEPERGWEGLQVRWLISREAVGSNKTVVGLSMFPPGAKHDLHRHPHVEEWEHVLQGHGIKRVGDTDISIEAGDTVFVPENEYHGVANTTDDGETLVTIWGYCGAASLGEAGYVLPEDEGADLGTPWP